MSGNTVRFIGGAMVGVVQAVDSVADLIGAAPTVVGGLAVMCRLSAAHRATVDLDVVDRLRPEAESQLVVLRRSPGTKSIEPSGVWVPTPSGHVRVDVLEIRQSEIDRPSDDPGDRLHASAHGWAEETATPVVIEVVDARGELVASASTPVAEPGPLIAMKLQAVMDRGEEKAGTDILDIVRLTLDRDCGQEALLQLGSCSDSMAADIRLHAEKWFDTSRDWSLKRVRAVRPADLIQDDLELVGELIIEACSRPQ